jgi:putative transcriptional regulator
MMTLPGYKMNDKLFAELMASIEEAGHIVREEIAPSRTFTVEREPLDVTGIREGYKLSQTRFAALLGISVKTLRNWEHRKRLILPGQAWYNAWSDEGIG